VSAAVQLTPVSHGLQPRNELASALVNILAVADRNIHHIVSALFVTDRSGFVVRGRRKTNGCVHE
jgi:hypothetical protein